MIKLVQFVPKPQMGIWLKNKAEQGCRSVASVAREIINEKMLEELSKEQNEVKRSETGGAK